MEGEKSLRILIVEDDEDWQRLLFPSLRRKYRVHTVSNYDEAMAILMDDSQSFDLLISNVLLHGDVTPEWQMEWTNVMGEADERGIPIIVVSAMNYVSAKAVYVYAERYHARAVFLKPELSRPALEDEVAKLARELDRVSVPPVAPLPGTSNPERWRRSYKGTHYELEPGVHQDIIAGLDQIGLDMAGLGSTDHQGSLWLILTHPQTEDAYACTIALWNKLWAMHAALPPFQSIELLAEAEYGAGGVFFPGYRDHMVHSFLVYLLGLYFYASSSRIQDAIHKELPRDTFLQAWRVAALFHDIGYLFNVPSAQASSIGAEALLERLRELNTCPLHTYAALHGEFELDEALEDLLRGGTAYRPWQVNSLSALRDPRKGGTHILDQLDSLMKGAHLASPPMGQPGRYLKRYDDYTLRMDADGFRHSDDHGLLSAMILLQQYAYFRDYVTSICSPDCLASASVVSDAARKGLQELHDRVTSGDPATNGDTVIQHAAAAMALHNINVAQWQTHDRGFAAARRDPFYLTLDQYKLSLAETPLAWLLAAADAWQCWDRRGLTTVPQDAASATPTHRQFSIQHPATGKLAVSFANDEYRYTPLSRFRKVTGEMQKQLADMDIFEEGKWPPPDL